MHWSDRRASVAVPDSLSYARMARIGASRPLPRVAATVCFLITERALSLGGRDWSSCPNPVVRSDRRDQRPMPQNCPRKSARVRRIPDICDRAAMRANSDSFPRPQTS